MKRTTLLGLLTAVALGCGSGAQNPTDGGHDDGRMMQDGNTPDTGGDAAVDMAEPEPTCFPPSDKDAPAEKLSQTGCMDPKNPKVFAPGVFAYEVNSPLWSDHADKERGFFLPKGGKIHVLDCDKEPNKCLTGPYDSGRYVFPIGTVLVKNFMFDGKVVETRLFIHFDDSSDRKWIGYGYKWNEEQTEATIVPPAGDDVSFNTGSRSVDWHYPSRDDCMSCHFVGSGFTLGPEMKQLNRMVGGENQIDTIAKRGAFEETPSKPYPDAIATPYSGSWGQATAGASVEQRARSYLHANCFFCHRPDSNFPGIDLRYDVPLENTSTCNKVPERGLIDVDDGRLIVPGVPEKSELLLRMKSLTYKVRMPNIASNVVDDDAVKVVEEWIKGMAKCPGE